MAWGVAWTVTSALLVACAGPSGARGPEAPADVRKVILQPVLPGDDDAEAATYEVFTSSGTWDFRSAGSPSTVDVLVVAGGGGGGAGFGGGGGAHGTDANQHRGGDGANGLVVVRY